MTTSDKATIKKLETQIKKQLKTIDGLKETLTVVQRTALESQRSALEWECSAKEHIYFLYTEGIGGDEHQARIEWKEAESRLMEFLGK